MPTGPLEEIYRFSTIRKVIAKHMRESIDTHAHVTQIVEVDMTRVVGLRKKLKPQFEQTYGVGLSFLPFIMRAVVDGIARWPWMNADVRGDEALIRRYVNMGMAVAIDDSKGLLVPVIKNAEQLNLVGLSRAIVDLADRARRKALAPDEMSGATFTITNPGVFGTLVGTPIIPHGSVGIIDTGALVKRPVVRHRRRRQRLHRDPLDDVPLDLLRPPARRRRLRRPVHAAGEEEPGDLVGRPTGRDARPRPRRTSTDCRAARPYAEALGLQHDLAAARSQHAIPDMLVMLEHEPVVTLGPRTDAAAEVPDRAALAARGIEVVETDRGGRATYHGPGQLVAYPILDLTRLGRDLRAYVATSRAVVATLADARRRGGGPRGPSSSACGSASARSPRSACRSRAGSRRTASRSTSTAEAPSRSGSSPPAGWRASRSPASSGRPAARPTSTRWPTARGRARRRGSAWCSTPSPWERRHEACRSRPS